VYLRDLLRYKGSGIHCQRPIKKDDKNLPIVLVIHLVTDNSLAKKVGTPTREYPVAEVRCVGSYVSVQRISTWLGAVVRTSR
jgi:hypothetical protein